MSRTRSSENGTGRASLARRLVAAGAMLAMAGTATLIGDLGARAQDVSATPEYEEADIRRGLQVWKDKVWCGQCHGWSGNGLPDDPRAPVGFNLRETLLTPEQFADVVRCGRPGTEMPAFDARAYVDDRCYGLTEEDLGDMTPPKQGVYLIQREINGLIAYVYSTIVGRGPFTDEDCRAYYGEDASICDTIRAGGVAQPPQITPP